MIDKSKKYKTRNGQEVTDIRTNMGGFFSIRGTLKGHHEWWSNTGAFTSHQKEHPLDLIEVQPEKIMQLEVGKKYKTRQGQIMTITGKTGRIEYPFLGTMNDCSYEYTEDGYYYQSRTINAFDLVEELSVVDLTKPVQTRDGHTVQLLTTEGRGKFPVIGYIGDSVRIIAWDKGGRMSTASVEEHPLDLVQTPPPVKVGYLNIYEPSSYLFTSREDADRLARNAAERGKIRVACIRYEYRPGQFDE